MALIDLVLSTIPKLNLAESHQDLDLRIREFLSEAMLDHYVVVLPGSELQGTTGERVLSSYPADWIIAYDKRGYKRVDPVYRATRTARRPIHWRESPGAGEPDAVAFFEAATEVGLGDGITIPLHGPGGYRALVSFSSSRRLEITEADEDAFYILAVYLHEKARRVLGGKRFDGSFDVELTRRERDILSWVLEGKADDEIAEILQIKYATIRFHLNNAGRKLRVSGRHNIAMRALMSGMING
jgi:LuxR family quorum-sensing transcriptional regulator LasR